MRIRLGLIKLRDFSRVERLWVKHAWSGNDKEGIIHKFTVYHICIWQLAFAHLNIPKVPSRRFSGQSNREINGWLWGEIRSSAIITYQIALHLLTFLRRRLHFIVVWCSRCWSRDLKCESTCILTLITLSIAYGVGIYKSVNINVVGILCTVILSPSQNHPSPSPPGRHGFPYFFACNHRMSLKPSHLQQPITYW